MELLIPLLVGVPALIFSGELFVHRRVTTYVAVAGALWQAMWLVLTLLDRVLVQGFSSEYIYIMGAGIFLLTSLFFVRRWQTPHISWGDGLVIIVVAVVALAAGSVIIGNGFSETGAWVSHGFYNGDTATFAALVERSFSTDSVVTHNPFAGGGELEYPTLLHAGFAEFMRFLGVENSWLHSLPWITLLQVMLTVPLFFLLWDIVFPEPEDRWVQWFGVPQRWVILLSQAGIVAYVLALSWDNYVYPQSHFFLTGLFLLLIGLLARGFFLPAYMLTFILLLSNAVTGTAASAIFILFSVLLLLKPGRLWRERGMYLAGIALIVALFLLSAPGAPAFGLRPNFSYTAAQDMERFAPIFILLVAGVLYYSSQQALLRGGVVVLAALALFTFLFSTRNIVIDNASRFFYHAVLIGFPLLLSPLIRLFYWLRRELVYTTHSLVELIIQGVAVAVVAGFALMPVGVSVLSAHDNLWFKDEQVVSQPELEALAWVRDHTAPEEIFLASPQAPFAIPLFTGRSLLRTDYWLSPTDIVQEKVKAAFAFSGYGEPKAAQEQVIPLADYVYLHQQERFLWEPLNLEKVFENNEIVIYRVDK